jgi:quercetin dioxygenase-like cupin family protein
MNTRSLANCTVILAGLLIPAATLNGQAAPAAPTRFVTPLAGDRRQAGLLAERIRFLAGDRGRPHTRSVELHVTVVSGLIFVNRGTRFDTTEARALKPGDFMVLPSGRAHFEWTDTATEIHVQGVGPMTTEYLDSVPKARR